jgi:hypothetical protein
MDILLGALLVLAQLVVPGVVNHMARTAQEPAAIQQPADAQPAYDLLVDDPARD